jgi:ELWxxDGT repeat protein
MGSNPKGKRANIENKKSPRLLRRRGQHVIVGNSSQRCRSSGNIGLWVTNGTAAGTQEIMSGPPSFQGGLKPANLTVFNGEVYFNAAGALWVTDGTAAGTHQLTNAVHAPSALAVLVGVDVAGHTGL